MEQYMQEEAIHGDWKSMNSTLDEPETNQVGGFECNICLDLVQDPVVTFCGHLYCWPCIYRWINFQDTSSDSLEPQKPQCPVCKTEVSQNTLIPLYGRGQTTKSFKDSLSDLIPERPPSPRCDANMLIPSTSANHLSPRRQVHHRPYRSSNHMGSSNYMASPMVDPMIGMFGEMVYARIFGNSETTLYTYPNSYHLAGSTSPRLRRHMMRTDKSLSRVCLFLCCCVILCLLLF